ncbi:MAG: FAD-binding oxidoreductase [Paracoccaceae bacterium]|nr:FAD-binding oxidoreductase [Paracoccaceae bacterium]
MINGDVSFWYADIGGLPKRRAPLAGNTTADICIVGAGYTGLWAAYYLKRNDPSLDILVIEKEFAGFGASGRNGGWLAGEFTWNRENYLKNGDKAALLEFERALNGSVDEVINVAEREGIDADILRVDLLDVACSSGQLARLEQRIKTDQSYGTPVEAARMIDAKETAARIDIANLHGAHLSSGVARVQPAKLVQGLARVVEQMGVRIVEGTTVTKISSKNVTTNKGHVSAPIILRATEGFTAGLEGQKREILPLNSAILVTEPLDQATWDTIGWQGHELLSDASHGYCYAQRTREGRIAMGGRGVPYRFGSKTDDGGETQSETIRQLREMLTRILPQTANVKIDHAWCGVMGVPRDWCASVGLDTDTGLGWSGGYVGIGVTTSNLAGRTLADLVLNPDSALCQLPWVNHKVRKWEPEPVRWLSVHGMYHLYHAADARERASQSSKTSRLARVADWLTGH